MFSLKAKHVNTGAGVAHMWLKWLRVLRGRWARMNPRGCRESSQAVSGVQLEPRWEGRARGLLLTGGAYLPSSSARVPTVEFAASDYCWASWRPALRRPRVCICLRAVVLKGWRNMGSDPYRIRDLPLPRLGESSRTGVSGKGVQL